MRWNNSCIECTHTIHPTVLDPGEIEDFPDDSQYPVSSFSLTRDESMHTVHMSWFGRSQDHESQTYEGEDELWLFYNSRSTEILLSGIWGDRCDTHQSILSIDIHWTGSTDSFSARTTNDSKLLFIPSECECWIDCLLDLNQGVKNHVIASTIDMCINSYLLTSTAYRSIWGLISFAGLNR